MGGEVFGLSLEGEGRGGEGAALSTKAGGVLRLLWSRAMNTDLNNPLIESRCPRTTMRRGSRRKESGRGGCDLLQVNGVIEFSRDRTKIQ